MKVLVIGQGAREHALAWKLAQSPLVDAVYVAPGNAGTAAMAVNVPVPATAVDRLAEWAERERIDLTVVGPEAALAAGVVDGFRARGLRIFGPTRAAARLETSKSHAKAFMARHGIATAPYEECPDARAAEACIAARAPDRFPLVIKADGLAAGKGVQIAADRREALAAVREHAGGEGSGRFVIEELLHGFEVSFLAIADGTSVRALACAHDYKRAHDGDAGPMTGGMGAYSPVEGDDALIDAAMRTVIEPAVAGMATEGEPFSGILYAGLMVTREGPFVLEFNARFGDPETQVLLPRWQDDLAQVLLAAADQRLAELPAFRWSDEATCGVVLASAGYPGRSADGVPIRGLAEAGATALVFHGATSGPGSDRDEVVSSGGRVLTVVGRGATRGEARRRAYEAAGAVGFAGGWSRMDIAERPAAGEIPDGADVTSPGS